MTGGCVNGMANVDSDQWDYDRDPCDDTDSQGTPCFNVEHGYLYTAISSTCNARLRTAGKFSYRYGYMEVEYTATLRYPGFWSNFSIVQWAGGFRQALRYQHDRFGVVVDSYEGAGKHLGVEMNLVEFVPQTGYWGGIVNMHQYVNWSRGDAHIDHPALRPRRADKFRQLRCGGRFALCNGDDEATLTSGIEWTPRGYRTFVKVHGVTRGFEVVRKGKVQTRYREPRDTGRYGSWTDFSDAQRRSLFEKLESGNPDSVLEQIGIAHVPADLILSAWGHQGGDHPIRARMKIHHVRVFQPANRYRDMEPVYQ